MLRASSFSHVLRRVILPCTQQLHPPPRRIPFLYQTAIKEVPGWCRTYAKKKGNRKGKKAHIVSRQALLKPLQSWRPDPTRCAGCGIRLQTTDPRYAGFLYEKGPELPPKSKEKGKKGRRKTAGLPDDDVYESVAQTVDKDIQEKLINWNVTHEETPLSYTESAGGDPEDHPDPDGRNFCVRCHQLSHHTDPMTESITAFPLSKDMNEIINDIKRKNQDPENPPLLVHVLDIADFPLSFVPFSIPEHSKVIFVINRLDLLCHQGSMTLGLREYLKKLLPSLLDKARMQVPSFEILPISADKGWGIKELIARLNQLRNKESNIYLIGTYPFRMTNKGNTNVGKSSIIAAMLHRRLYKELQNLTSDHALLSPTVSVFPHTTLGTVEIPFDVFKQDTLTTQAKIYDTPGVECDSTYFAQLLSKEYARPTFPRKRDGFQRPAQILKLGTFILKILLI
jgi:hypothetical protein